jgi:protease I
MSNRRLSGKRIAILATYGCDQTELAQPWEATNKAGSEVVLISLKEGRIQGMNHDEKADRCSDDQSVHSSSTEILDRPVLELPTKS